MDALMVRQFKKQIQTVVKNTYQEIKKVLDPIVVDRFFSQEDKNIVLKQDVLQHHAVALPQNVDIDKLQPLITKLHTALIETHSTVAIGSTNKISSYQKMCSTHRNSLGELREVPSVFHFSPLHKPASIKSHVRYELFQNNPHLSKLMDFVIQAEKMRIGNCTELAAVAASYLWRFPGNEIKRIELVKAIDFDHVWLILNRKKDSDLLNSAEWGEDCWVLDPWWKDEGVFYHAQHFQKKIIEVLSYLITQYEWLKKNGLINLPFKKSQRILNQYKKDFQKRCLNIPIKLKNKIAIDVDVTPYPFDSSVRISDCYEEVPLRQKQEHQKKFQPCLDEIKKIKKKIL